MSKKANELKSNNTISYEGKILKIISTKHIKPGKGPAYIQAVTKNLENDTNKIFRFKTDESITTIEKTTQECLYLYDSGNECFFVNPATHDEIVIKKSTIKNFNFLTDDMKVIISFLDGKPCEVILPNSINCTVDITDPVVKGQNAGTGRKTAILTNGVRLQVPLHITDKTKIIINPNTLEYSSKQ